MNAHIDVWNTLHDGEITALAQDDVGTLVMFVSIPYLRRRLAPLGDSFALRLHGFRTIEFSGFDSAEKTTSLEEIAEAGLEILSTDSQGMPVEVTTTLGSLTIDFDSVSITLDTGESVEPEDVERVSREYWEEWSARHQKA